MPHFTLASLIIATLTKAMQRQSSYINQLANASKANHYFASNPLLDEFYERYFALKCYLKELWLSNL